MAPATFTSSTTTFSAEVVHTELRRIRSVLRKWTGVAHENHLSFWKNFRPNFLQRQSGPIIWACSGKRGLYGRSPEIFFSKSGKQASGSSLLWAVPRLPDCVTSCGFDTGLTVPTHPCTLYPYSWAVALPDPCHIFARHVPFCPPSFPSGSDLWR